MPLRRENGFASIMIIGMMVLLMTFASGFLSLYHAHSIGIINDENRLAALSVAEGGSTP